MSVAPTTTPSAATASTQDLVRDREAGFALPMVLALVLVVGLLVASLGAVVATAAGATSSTRASVQAQASAEAGIDAVRAALTASTPTLSCTYAPPAGAAVRYVVEARFGPEVTGAPACGSGVPAGSASASPTGADVLLVSTGSAARPGLAGTSQGDRRRVEAVVTRSAAGTALEGALVGYGGISVATGLEVTSTSSQPGSDVVTQGDFRCASSMTLDGDLYVGGDALFQSGPCVVRGDVFVRGALRCTDGMTITGDLVVQGQLDLRTSSCVVRGTTRTGTTTWPAAATAPFPHLTRDDSTWSTWLPAGWRASVGPLRKPGVSMDVCAMSWGGDQFARPLVVSTPTVYDTTTAGECGSRLVLGAGMTFELYADAVVLVTSLTQNGNVTIRSGDGGEHSLYLVQPWSGSEGTCAASSAASGTALPDPKIRLGDGTWTQDDRTSVLLYSPTGVDVATQARLRGQVYGCRVVLSTTTRIEYQPVGPVRTGDVGPWTVRSWRGVPTVP